MAKPILYHIPVCPFSQRVDILLELKGLSQEVQLKMVDITRPRDPALLAKTRGTTALPVLELEDGRILKESLVLLRYFEDRYPEPRVARTDPFERAVENMLIATEDAFVSAGYRFVMNQDADKRAGLAEQMTAQYRKLDEFLSWHAPKSDFLFERFGLAECVFTPIFARFWFLDYYEGWDIPAELTRVRRWRESCLAHPAAQQVSREEIVKLYYDYAWGAGNGALLPGRARSSFVFEPHWRSRPWPPAGKKAPASDSALGIAA